MLYQARRDDVNVICIVYWRYIVDKFILQFVFLFDNWSREPILLTNSDVQIGSYTL